MRWKEWAKLAGAAVLALGTPAATTDTRAQAIADVVALVIAARNRAVVRQAPADPAIVGRDSRGRL